MATQQQTFCEELIQESYNKFEDLPLFPNRCVSYLMEHNELVWKLLKYTSADAWKQPNLTHQEKADLVFDGSQDETQFRVFLDTGQDEAWTFQACILRISVLDAIPINYVYGNVCMAMEVYTHYKISHLSNYQVRNDTVIQSLIKTFNGATIAGLGKLYFDHKASPSCRISTIGNIPFKGKVAVLCNYIA